MSHFGVPKKSEWSPLFSPEFGPKGGHSLLQNIIMYFRRLHFDIQLKFLLYFKSSGMKVAMIDDVVSCSDELKFWLD